MVKTIKKAAVVPVPPIARLAKKRELERIGVCQPFVNDLPLDEAPKFDLSHAHKDTNNTGW